MAARDLGLDDGKPGLPQWLKTWTQSGTRALVGMRVRACRANFMAQGICQSFTGVDVSEAALDQARIDAEAAGLDIAYVARDLNHIRSMPNPDTTWSCARPSCTTSWP